MKPIYRNFLPGILINPTVLDWMSVIAPWLCMSILVFPYSRSKSCLEGGGSVVERLRSTQAYGWVEHCSDIASCGTSSIQDKCSSLCYYVILYNCISCLANCLMECDEHVSMLN